MNWKMKGVASLCVYLCLAVTLSSLIMSTNAYESDTIFAVVPTNSAGQVGETFTVEVKVYDAFYLFSWQVYMSWNDAVLQYVSHTFSGFLTGQPEGSSVNVRVESDFSIIGEATVGQWAGISVAEGSLYSVTFLILSETYETIAIDHASYTKIVECFSPPMMNTITDFDKQNGYYVAPWAEDFNKDGIVDIWDISCVCILYGEPLIQTKSASSWTGAWINPENVVDSDDVYAETKSKYLEETYDGYGFVTAPTLWQSVTKVEVGVELSGDGDDYLALVVSNDGGTTWSPTPHNVIGPTTEQITWIDATSDFAWTPDMLSNANFKVKLTYTGSGGKAPIFVDWVPARVTFHPYADLNDDGFVDIADLSMVAVKFGETYL